MKYDALEDQPLVAAFLDTVQGLTLEEVEAAVPELSASTVARWRRGEFERINERNRHTIASYLEAIEDVPAEDRQLAGRLLQPVLSLADACEQVLSLVLPALSMEQDAAEPVVRVRRSVRALRAAQRAEGRGRDRERDAG